MPKLPTPTDLELLLAPNVIEKDLRIRFACEFHLERLGLSWKSPRIKKFLEQCCGWPGAILADADKEMLLALLRKLEAESTPEGGHRG